MQRSKYFVFLFVLLMACNHSSKQANPDTSKLFKLLSAEETGIDFENQLTFDKDFNINTYRNFYNGGGVAIGDVNNDGLQDIYFTSNMASNRLYLNKGGFKFKDITQKAGVEGNPEASGWATGVSMADVNGDGWLDIYVCNSGDVKGDNKENELFINNGNPSKNGHVTFTEKAKEYGLADKGFSTHAAFFDYDKDGDLDLYLLNNSYRAIGSFNLMENERYTRDTVGGDKLFRNDSKGKTPKFVDVSEEAGIYGSVIGFGLGVTVGDINKDGWLDIYVSNDFFERDYIYINNQDGTFTEELEKQMRSNSAASMGADMADMNNDGFSEIFVTEMLPEKEERIKTVTTFESWDDYQNKLHNDYYHQFTRNMLQYHNGVSSVHQNKGGVTFSEIGRLAGVEATDWSWGALITDLDNDGLKDLFIANGIYQDLTDMDYLLFSYANRETDAKRFKATGGVDHELLISRIPSNKIANYAYHNNGHLNQTQQIPTFTNKAKEWGLDTPSFSNGSAYADLDNDGDLDLVVNNVNMPCFVYENRTDTFLNHHYLKFNLKGSGKNTQAIGAKLTIKHQGQTFYLEQMPIRGFQSTVDPRPNFGLGNFEMVDSVIVQWSSDKFTILTNVKTNQTLTLEETAAKERSITATQKTLLFQDITQAYKIDYQHQENNFNDFNRDRLIYHKLSTDGPKICKGDVNGDGLEDFYVGGAKDSFGKLFIQQQNGTFKNKPQPAFEKDKLSEDLDCIFFDADGDKDLDLYVSSGGNEFSPNSFALQDRLYLNAGNGNFTKSNQLLPIGQPVATSCVQTADYDNDGDLDLVVGGRLRPFLYGVPASTYILNNNGKGQFTNVSNQIAPELKDIGMVMDLIWADIDNDKDTDLILVGEWMPITIFKNENGQFKKQVAPNLQNSKGWWNCIKSGDFDKDGDIDFVVGNHGLNSRFKAVKEKPVTMYINDFDQNGSAEQIICTYNGTASYPLVLRHTLIEQLPYLKRKYLKYNNYKNQTIDSMFSAAQLKKAVVLEANNFSSSLLLNQGDGTFKIKALPKAAQVSPIYGLLVDDFDADGQEDILLGGNFYPVKPEVGRYDASYGLLLKGNGKGNFKALLPRDTGFFLTGEVRDMIVLKKGKTKPSKPIIFVANNNAALQVFQYQ